MNPQDRGPQCHFMENAVPCFAQAPKHHGDLLDLGQFRRKIKEAGFSLIKETKSG